MPDSASATVRRSRTFAFGVLPRLVGDDGLSGLRDPRLNLFHLIPQGLGFLIGQELAVDHHWLWVLAFGNLDQVEAEFLGVGHPSRMIAADIFAAAFNPATRYEVIEGHDPAAHSIAGL